MATFNEIKELALHVAKNTAPANFTKDDVATAYAAEIQGLCGSVNEFRKNKFDIFEIVQIVVDEVVPAKAIDVLGMFADIKVVGRNERALFRRGLIGKNRAKKFLTQVGLSGVYESFRLDTDTFEVRTTALGGAARIDYERFAANLEDINDLIDIVLEGLTEAIYLEVQKALKAAISSVAMPSRNKVTGNSFDAASMAKVIGAVRAYGTNAVIFATPEFIEDMGADAVVVGLGTGAYPNVAIHPQDLDDIRNTGRIKIFRGTPIVEIPQSFVDETNEQVYIDPSFAYVLPAGGEKVVKVVLEGPTEIYDSEGRDRSIEINIYKKVGVGILTFHNWGIYQNTSLLDGVWLYGEAKPETETETTEPETTG